MIYFPLFPMALW
uniref:Uncharacterized protein n=1 Tax=Arundo donax TaxID=35708 RepID=A0A0A9CFQ9_ARUDO